MSKSFFYSDLLKDHENRFKKHFYQGNVVFRVKSKPTDTTSISHAFRLKKNVGTSLKDESEGSHVASYDFGNSTTLKHNLYTNQVNAKLKLQNESILLELTGKPADYNTRDLTLNLKHSSKYTPHDGSYETTNGIKFGSPLVGPLRFWTTLDYVYNTKNINELKSTLNIQAQDVYHIGLKLDHDLSKVTNLVALFALKNLKGDFFGKMDIMKNIITLGCNHIHGPRALHSVEFSYDVTNKTKGVFGQPLTALWAAWYLLHDNVQLKLKFDFSNDIKVSTAWVQQIDPRFKIIFADNINLSNLVNQPGKSNYNFGLKFEYSL